MQKLYILDGLNFLFRSYYAIGPMTGPDGQSTNALYGFIRTLYKLMRDVSPTHLIVVFDGPDNKKQRTAIYQDYKSHRKGMPEDLLAQIAPTKTFCDLAGIPHIEIPGVEADDTMGSIAVWAAQKNISVYVCTSDKDFCQLVNDKIHLLNIHKDNLEINPQKVEEIHGVAPHQIIDLLAMMGDASDNIPGIPGFGQKTAASLLQEFGSLDALLQNPEKIKGVKKQQALIEGRESALLSRKLATICLNVEFPKEEHFFHLRAPDIEGVKQFYHRMRFLSLLKEMGQQEESTPTGSYQMIDEEETLQQLVDRLKQESAIVIDTETSCLEPMQARLVGIGLCAKAEDVYYVPMNGTLGKKRALQILQPLFETSHIGWIGHNIKYDLHALANEGVMLSKIVFDTMVASYLLSPQNQRHNLDQLSLEHFGKVKIPIEQLIGKGQKQISMEEVALDRVTEYCCEDVDYTYRLYTLFQKELRQADLEKVLHDIELPLLPILLHMERRGIKLEIDRLKTLSHRLHHQLDTLQNQIFTLAGCDFNLNSPKQLSQILFEKLGISPPKKTTTGFSTSADVLESLREESPIIEKILEYRVLEKLRSTYVDALPLQALPPNHHIHCTFNQSVAATGRLSCQNPNLQNIPVRTPEGVEIRSAFIPSQNDYSFVSADYSQIELRLLAHLSEDPALLKAFNQGEDIHAFTASLVFNTPLEDVTPQMRHQAKTVNFGILYGQGPYGLSQQLGIPQKEAAVFIETYFERYKKVREFLEFCKEGVRTTGRAITMTGRQRPIPDIHSKNPAIRSSAERLAINTPLQGTAADLIKLAMIDLENQLSVHKHLGQMLLQIHDELLLEGPTSTIDQLGSLAKQCMESVLHLKVPLVVDISIGKNWGDC